MIQYLPVFITVVGCLLIPHASTADDLDLPEIEIEIEEIDPAKDKEPIRFFLAGRPSATPEAKSAATPGLEWLASHQAKDGSWSFAHRHKDCDDECLPSGKFAKSKRMATGLVLLAYLGAMHTHKGLKYSDNVQSGIDYLLREGKVEADRELSFHEPGSGALSHATATLALTSAYAMTADKKLLAPAQDSVNHIVQTQDRMTGGWRIGEAGDCSIELTAWYVMSLKSAHLADLIVPKETIENATHFLDSVQHDGGAKYGIGKPNVRATAAALLARLYLGWKTDDKRVRRGLQFVADAGPTKGTLESRFLAHQLLFHCSDTKHWAAWNTQMLSRLVAAQGKKGHTKGSWHFMSGDPWADNGGRVYSTATSMLILEVYYRHLPIFGPAAVREKFY